MNYQERVIAYIDILGFRDKIQNTIDKGSGEENELETNKINNLFENVLELKNKYKYIDNNVNNRMVSHFSDSVVVSYPMEEEAEIFHIFSDILFFGVSILQDGYLIRGAITSGKLHHSENKLYGPAMLSAYNMERKMAFYPRIIFENKIIEIIKKNQSKLGQLKVLNNLIQKDIDGLYYLDYFRSMCFVGANEGLLEILKAFKDRINELEKKIENNDSIKSKYLWLKEKYNIALNKIKSKNINEKIIIECPELYDFLINEGNINEEVTQC